MDESSTSNASTRWPYIAPLEGIADFPRWRRNAKAYLTRHDAKLIGLQEAPPVPQAQGGPIEEAWIAWIDANAVAKANIILMLSDSVQIRATAFVDDETKTARELWNFLATTYTASNEQAIQNIRVKLDSLVYIEGADWDAHLNEFNTLIAQLAMQNVAIEDKAKKSMLIRSLPESLSVISTIASAQPEMTIESLDALVRAEIDRKKNPHNPQGKSVKIGPTTIIPSARFVRRGKPGSSRSFNRHKPTFKKKGQCFYCGKEGHFKRECRSFLRQSGENNRNFNRYGNNNRRHNNNGNNSSWGGGSNQKSDFDAQAFVSALKNMVTSNNQNNQQPPPPPPFGGFMAKMKFRCNVAELSRHKTSDAYIDSGATHHFFHRRDSFKTYEEITEEPVKGAAGITKIVGKGMVHVPIDGGIYVLGYHAPEFSSNILSVRLIQKDYEVLFSDSLRDYSACLLMRKGTYEVINEYKLKEGLYPVQITKYGFQSYNLKANTNPIDEWHRKLGHPHANRHYALSRMDNDVPKFDRSSLLQHQCIPCMTAKFERSKIRTSTRKTTRPLELVHLDISGKVAPSIHGYIYTVVFLDDFTAKSDVKLLKKKSELFQSLLDYKTRSEIELQAQGISMTNIRMDNAGENMASTVQLFCSQHGIRIEPSPPRAAQSNGAAERLVQEHWTRARVILFSSNLPNNLWSEAIEHGNWIRNRLPARRINGDIPMLRWDSQHRVKYSNLLEFGTPGFAYIYRNHTTPGKKLLPRSVYGHFVGMFSDTTIIKVYIPQTKQIIHVRRNDFREYKGKLLPGVEVLLDGIAKQVEMDEQAQQETQNESTLYNTFIAMRSILATCMLAKKKKFDPNVPRSFEIACQYPGWRKAIDREYNALISRGTWSYVKIEPGMNIVPFTWVFKVKPLDAEGKKFMEKARCCLRGDQQLAYVDYDPTNIYAPVASHDSIRMLISLAAAEDSFLEGADVSNAYLYGDLKIPIIMEQPTDSSQRPAKPGHACKLLKSIYGAKQAGEIWGSLLDKSLKNWGFKVSRYDHRIYLFRQGAEYVTIAIVVDDLAFASNSTRLMNQLKENLSANFDVKLFGNLTSFVGWNISRTQQGIKIDQRGYVISMLKEHGLEEANAVRCPLPRNADVRPANENDIILNDIEHKRYRSMVGALLYLAICTRPDISFSVAVLARQVHKPTVRHLNYIKRVMRFVAGTVEYGLMYPRSEQMSPRSLCALVDADWGGCQETRKSTSGWIIAINGTPIVWRTRKQTIIATSSAESEYVALFDCVKHTSWMRKLYWEMSTKESWPENGTRMEATTVFMDSKAAAALAKNEQVSARNKHIDLKYHFVKAALGNESVVLKYVRSADNPADMLTKILDLPTSSHLCSLIRLSGKKSVAVPFEQVEE